MGKNRKKPTPKAVSGGGGKSEKTYRRSASTAVDEDTEMFISLAIDHKEEGDKLFKKGDQEGAMVSYGKAISLLPKDHTDVADLRTRITSCYMELGLGSYPNASANEIPDRVKKRLVEEGIDVDEMESFVSVQPARLRKIVHESGGKDDEPAYAGMNVAETNAEATLTRNIEIQMKAAAITTESAATDVVHDAEETNLDQEAKDPLLSQEEMDKTKLGVDSLENPKPLPRRILGESSTKTQTYLLYTKGLVSEEVIKSFTTKVGGSGLSLCDSNDNSKLETNKALRNRVLLSHPEAVELAAIIQGLSWALELGVENIQFFCDDSTILDYVTRKAAPPNESILAKLLDKLAPLQTRFTSCQALPLRTDISSVIKLARDAIASQTRWQREDGVIVEACVICYEDVPTDEKFTVSGCFHRICFDCMRQYITHCLQNRVRLVCPNAGCKSELKPADCNQIVEPNQLALMVERKAEESIEVSDRVYCPYPRCSTLMSARGLPEVDPALPGARKCLGCGLRFCVDCKMEWHTKLSCAEFRKTKAYTKSGTAVFDAAAQELGLKKCRKCLCTVERAEGPCMHMTCTVCKYEFCYICGNDWKSKCRCATKVHSK